MKKILVILLAVGVSFALSKWIIFRNTKEVVEYTTAQAFQVGAFSNYENAKKCAERNQGIVVHDDEHYFVYVSVLTNPEAIERLSDYYKSVGFPYYLKNIQVRKDFTEKIKNDEDNLIDSHSDMFSSINYHVLQEFEKSL